MEKDEQSRMIRGVSVEIPNEYGSFLGELLKPFPGAAYNWWVGAEESYRIVNGEFEPMFLKPVECMNGEVLKNIIETEKYYLIFQDLKAFPKTDDPIEINTYSDFLTSECELSLLVIDTSYVAIYCKDAKIAHKIHTHAQALNYSNIRYITDENDFRTKLTIY